MSEVKTETGTNLVPVADGWNVNIVATTGSMADNTYQHDRTYALDLTNAQEFRELLDAAIVQAEMST